MVKKKETISTISTIEEIPGVGAATVEKLNLAGYYDLMSVAVAAPGQLAEAAGVSEASARKMIQQARDNMNLGFESGPELIERREKIFRVSTGSVELDRVLGGGVESGSITEGFGCYGSGKSQMAHILAVNTLKQFPDSKVVFIDTEGTFRPERIKQLATHAGLDSVDVMNRCIVGIAYNSNHQMLLAEKAGEMLSSKKEDIKLIIVDSLTAHFRVEYLGRGTLATRQQTINRHMHILAKTAQVYNAIVFVTNQVMSTPDSRWGNPEAPIGGNIVGHNSVTRLYIRRSAKNTRKIKLIDSPHLKDDETVVEVTDAGFVDVK